MQQITSSADAAEKDSPGETSTQTSVQTLTEPPAGSQLKVTQQDGTDAYEVPAQGWRKAKSLVMFAVFWNAFMLFFSGVTIWGMLHAPQVGLWETVGLIAFEGIFWAVGIGLAIWAWDMATRSAMIGVAGEQMFIETKSSFGTKWVEFNQSKIHSISVQNSGTSVNDVPIKHLLVETEGQPPVGLFANGGRCVLVVVWRGIRCNGNLRLALQLAQVNSGRFPRTTNDHSTVAARNEATDVRARRHQEYLHRNERVKNWQPDTLPIGSSHP